MFKFNLQKVVLSMWCAVTLMLIFSTSSNVLYIALAFVLSTMFCLKHHKLLFSVFVLNAIAWGATLNLEYRMGNIMLSDISMLVLFVSMVLYKENGHYIFRKAFLLKESFVIILFAIFMILIGTASGFYLSNILQDLKLFLYIFIPYVYFIAKKKTFFSFNEVINLSKIYLITVFILEVQNIYEVGLDTMVANGFGNRDVAIIVQFVPVVACLFFKKPVKHRVLCQVLCFVTCVCSFTRTIWIAYLATILVALAFYDCKFSSKIKRILMLISLSTLILVALSYLMPDFISRYLNAIVSRALGLTDSTDTLAYRFSQSEELINTKILRICTIWGSGFGEITEIKNSVFVENSILYYLWKYGLIFTSCILVVLVKIYCQIIACEKGVVKICFFSILIFLCVGNFSGNLNLYYCMPVLSMVFAYPRMKRNYKVSDRKRY